MPAKKDDPLVLADIDPVNIQNKIIADHKAKVKEPSELDLAKEERLKQKEERMAARMPSKPPPQKELPPDPVDASFLLDKVNAYRERFPHLKSRNSKLSAKSKIEEIEDELHFLELQLGGIGDGRMAQMVYIGALSAAEQLTTVYNPLNLKLHGLGQVAQENPQQFAPILDELMIKYSMGLYMSPEMRLVLMTASLVGTVHLANSGNTQLIESMRKMQQKMNPPATDL